MKNYNEMGYELVVRTVIGLKFVTSSPGFKKMISEYLDDDVNYDAELILTSTMSDSGTFIFVLSTLYNKGASQMNNIAAELLFDRGTTDAPDSFVLTRKIEAEKILALMPKDHFPSELMEYLKEHDPVESGMFTVTLCQ